MSPELRSMMQELLDGQREIKHKLDTLLDALAEEDSGEAQPQLDLEGQPAGAERDPTQSLD